MPVLMIMVIAMSCTKDPGENTTPYIPPPVVSPPSGMIDTFYLTDSVVPFNTFGSTMKWLVTGTNTQTIVTLNGVKIAFYGALDTGPLKQTTTFTLAINNGKQAARTLRVADSVTTNLWNNGKRLKIIMREVSIWNPNSNLYEFRDTTSSIDAYTLDQRIYFSYFGTSKLYQKTANTFVALNDGGRFVVLAVINPTTTTTNPSAFTWQGILYTIVTLDSNFLVVTYDAAQPNGPNLKTRDTYLFE